MPAMAHNRLGDNWRPLFAIAEVAGGDWPQLARDAFAKLTTLAVAARPSALHSHALLKAIRNVFVSTGHDRIHTHDLITALQTRSASNDPQLSTITPQQITPMWLSHKLRSHGIIPKTIRMGSARAKGYCLADFPPVP